MVQVISNKEIGRLLEIDVVNFFIAKHGMQSVVCRKSDEYSLLLFSYPFFVEFCDYKAENYLETVFSDFSDGLLMTGGAALACSMDLNLPESMPMSRSVANHSWSEIFLSHRIQKLENLYSFLNAIDAIFPFVRAKGLSSMKTGAFDRRFDFSKAVSPLYTGLPERYFACIK